MVEVKPLPPLPDGVDLHVAALGGRMLELVRQTLGQQDWGGLRPSHFRLLSLLSADGTTITDLSGLLFMTKQAAGQFVTQLEDSGHVAVTTDQQDRRRRVVVRTALGERTVRDVNAAIGELEQRWRELVGAQRYRTFRAVLEQIAAGGA